ncbi:MAG: LuxR C-terminal-related transcriptional regulator [Chloroflexota bacterium]
MTDPSMAARNKARAGKTTSQLPEALNASIPGNLPHNLTRPIGREHEAASLRDLLLREDVTLVTLTGFGGAGKTTLALHVASTLLEHFNGGIFFVNLATVTKIEAIPLEIAHTLGVSYEAGRSVSAGLKDLLTHRKLLLILDNFEHLMPGAGFVLELLETLPHLKIIVTSRDPLRLRVERVYPLPPLETGDAVDLFIQRAQSVKPDFQPAAGDRRAIADLCERLGGLPLAVELAAMRAKLFTPQAMLARLRSDLEPASRFLSLFSAGARDLPERQQSLRKTIAWSYSLLDSEEQRILRAASIFPGGFGVPTLVKLLDLDEFRVLEIVDSLADKNLLKTDQVEEGEPRFSMLEAIREFAWDEIRAQAELDELKRRFVALYLDLARQAELHLRGVGQPIWMNVIETEYANLIMSMEIGATAPVDSPLWLDGLWILAYLEQYWMMRALFNELMPLSARALALIEQSTLTDEHTLSLKAALLSLAGTCAWLSTDFQRAVALHEASLSIYRELGDKSHCAFALNNIAVCLTELGDNDEAFVCYSESLMLYEEIGDHWGQTRLHWNLSNYYTLIRRDFSRLAHHNERGLFHAERSGDLFMLAAANLGMGEFFMLQGDIGKALTHYGETARLGRLHHYHQALTNSLTGLCSLALLQGDLPGASEVIREGAPLAFKQSDWVMLAAFVRAGAWLASLRKNLLHLAFLVGMHQSLWSGLHALDTIPDMWQEKEAALKAARAQLGDAAFEAEMERGRVTPLEEALVFLLDVCLLAPLSAPVDGGSPPGGLTEREIETLRLLVQGKSNQQISRELFVTLKTVEKHVGGIMRKLGAKNRTEAAAWAMKHGLASDARE